MRNYLSIIFKFQLAVGTCVSKIDNLRPLDYFSYGVDKSFYPYSKPLKDELGFQSEREKFNLEMGGELSVERIAQIESISKQHYGDLKKWELDCVQNPKFRKELKKTVYNRVQDVYEKIIISKNETKSNIDYNYLTKYSTYNKSTIDSWLKIWAEMELKNESLENLMTFSIFRKNCLNEELVRLNQRKLSNERRKTEQFFREQERHYINNSYEEGGGGDDWSDSSSYW